MEVAQNEEPSDNTELVIRDLPWEELSEEEREWWNEFEEIASDPRNWGFWLDITKT